MNISRRGFLAGIGAGLAGLGSGAGYRKLIPFVAPAENLVPGVATWYASACRECPGGCGLLLRNREARIVKAEGNPLHPINAGRLCARGQACLQGLYNPDRLARPRRRADGGWQEASWDAALAAIGPALADAHGRLGVITDLQSGSLAGLLSTWITQLGGSPTDVLVYEPLNYEPLRAANAAVYGRAEIPDYHLERADLLLSFGVDFLETWLSPVQLTRRFHRMRRVRNGHRAPFYYIGPRRSPTAVQADRYLQATPAQMAALAQWLQRSLRRPQGVAAGDPGIAPADARELVEALRRARRPLVLAGDPLPAGAEAQAVAQAAALLNAQSGTTAVDFRRTHALSGTATIAQQQEFLQRAAAGEFAVILILHANPLYAMPPALKAAEALGAAKLVVCLNSFEDETVAAAGHWALPVNAPAESWGDYSPQSGIHTLMQPAMGTHFESREAGDVLLQLARAAGVELPTAFGADTWYDYLRAQWRRLQQVAGLEGDFEEFWQRHVQEGGLTLPAAPVRRGTVAGQSAAAPVTLPAPEPGTLRLYVHPSLHHYDGRSANRPWLQEIPDPMTRAVWGSWVELHPESAAPLNVRSGDLVEVATDAGTVRLPVHVWEGVAPGVAALAAGQGHTAYGRYAKDVGVNAFGLLAPGTSVAARVRSTGRPGEHIRIHGEQNQHGRGIALAVALEELATAPPEPISLPLPAGYDRQHDVYHPGHEHTGFRWAMAVDLDRCTGCNACVVACYAENNIPLVGPLTTPVSGKAQLAHGREMTWIRIDR
ncbi:MAG: molybdopterin-dependent oxidoreductase, partial [Armatimonadetes bacterium]|nr:molybdopterin-dependent oxidoreductase [Armatimonadota bacterium]